MGVGKTSVGQLLGKELSLPVIDLDDMIEREVGMPIPSYFAQFGEDKFRKLEQSMLQKYRNFSGVVSTGGGCVEADINRQLLSSLDKVIYLEASIETIWNRLNADVVNQRPLADKNSFEALEKRYNNRLSFYKSASNYRINTDSLNIQQIVQEIISLTV